MFLLIFFVLFFNKSVEVLKWLKRVFENMRFINC